MADLALRGKSKHMVWPRPQRTETESQETKLRHGSASVNGQAGKIDLVIREICSRHVARGPCEHVVCVVSQKRLPVAMCHASAFRSRACH